MQKSNRLFAAVSIAAIALPAAAYAAPLGGAECYGRDYGPEEWQRYPNLEVVSIAVRSRPKTMSTGAPSTSRLFGVQLAVTKKDGGEEYRAPGDCKPVSEGFKCNLESDGGDFFLVRDGDNLRLETRRIDIEGNKSLTISPGKDGLARSFTLIPDAAAPCDFD